MNCLCCAEVYLGGRQDGELNLLTDRLIDFYRDILDLPQDFESQYLMIRSKRAGMSEEQKQLIEEEKFYARSKGGTNCYDNESGIFNPDRVPDGWNNFGAWCRDNKIGIFDPKYADVRSDWGRKGGNACYDNESGIFDTDLVPDGYSSWGEWARDKKIGIFDTDLVPDGYSSWGAWCRDNKSGIFDPKNADKVLDGSKKGGTNSYDNESGMFDPKNADKVLDGRKKGGTNSYDNKSGVHDPKNADKVHDGQLKGGEGKRKKALAEAGREADSSWKCTKCIARNDPDPTVIQSCQNGYHGHSNRTKKHMRGKPKLATCQGKSLCKKCKKQHSEWEML